ncbi:MAG: capsule biosynthesis protein [Hydrogenovibrio sp.]
MKKGLTPKSRIYIWGRKSFPEVEAYAREYEVPLYRVEDGFVRSVALGSDLTQPYSLVVDRRGIYFDPTQESDLEHALATYDLSTTTGLEKRAAKAAAYLVEKKLSKYNLYGHQALAFPRDRRVILVPGQVEDDASIQYGADGMTNLQLLEQVRRACPDAYIVFKPHPDVLVGNRKGQVSEDKVKKLCNQVVTQVSLDSVLEHADEVHTLTSLVGFEALLRGKKVVTYGRPFYAGWGLTVDLQPFERRNRYLTLEELVAGALFLYPRYIDPIHYAHCELEQVFSGIEQESEALRCSRWLRFKKGLRNSVIRKGQKLGRWLRRRTG